MKKTICFISIFELTKVFYEISIVLEKQGHRCIWITTNKKYTSWLLEKGVKKEFIIELVFDSKDFLGPEAIEEITDEIVSIERDANITVNLAMLADRFIMDKQDENINQYMILYFYSIKKFLTTNNVDMVFCEPTNSNEMIAWMVCQSLGVIFLHPQNLRIPDSRFFFQQGAFSGRMYSPENNNCSIIGSDFINNFFNKKPQPRYFHLNKKMISPRKLMSSVVSRLKTDLFLKKNHLTHHALNNRISLLTRRILNSFYLKYLFKYNGLESIVGRIAFYGLHVQPESSIDISSPYYSDQLNLIKCIRRSLPFDTALIIKEHSNFLGIKPLSFFHELKKIPNTYIIHHDISIFEVLKCSDIVFTVSGTSAYEAGLLGIPAVTFSDVFFNGFSSVHYCNNLSELKALVFYLLDEFKNDKVADGLFVEKIWKKSYNGYWSDPYSAPSVLEHDNINDICEGFLDVVENFHN